MGTRALYVCECVEWEKRHEAKHVTAPQPCKLWTDNKAVDGVNGHQALSMLRAVQELRKQTKRGGKEVKQSYELSKWSVKVVEVASSYSSLFCLGQKERASVALAWLYKTFFLSW